MFVLIYAYGFYLGGNTVKKVLSILLAAVMVFSLAGCGKDKDADFEWTRQGYFKDDNDNLVYIHPSEDEEYPGWTVGCMIEEGMYGWYIQQEGKTLHGNVNAPYMEGDAFVVTVEEEGEDGILLTLESGKVYHLKAYEMPEAKVVVTINTKGDGAIAYAKEGEELVFDDEFPSQSAYLGLEDFETYTFGAKPDEGNKFWKWTKNGEDFSTDEVVTFELNENADYTAWFGKKGSDETHVDLDSVKTMGELLGLPEYGTASGDGKFMYGFEQDWVYYCAVASASDEVINQVIDLDWDDPEYSSKLAAIIGSLEVEKIINISEKELKGDALKAVVGKSGEELLNEGWIVSGYNLQDMQFTMSYDCFSYYVDMEGEIKDKDNFNEEEDIKSLKVKSIVCNGIEDHTALD